LARVLTEGGDGLALCATIAEGAERFFADPSRRGAGGRGIGEAGSERQRGCAEGGGSYADGFEGPGGAFVDEVAGVGGGAFDEGEAGGEDLVGEVLVMEREAGEEGEAGAFNELVAGGVAPGPLIDFAQREGRRHAVEEFEAGGIDDAPVVEVTAPAVHLCGGDLGGVVDEGGEQAGFVPAGLPEGLGEGVVAAEALGEGLELGHRHAECFGRGDSVAWLEVVAGAGVAELGEFAQEGFGVRGRAGFGGGFS
jgi:hypothetical protein